MTDVKVANVVGGKTARACDSCIRKRARWYCAADDAFLCQSCDSSVHSANPLARRHERVRLKTSSFKSSQTESSATTTKCVPTWHGRKARTPRGKQNGHFKSLKSDERVRNPFYLVPEVLSDETTSFDESDGQLLYGRVPNFDSFAAELCCSPPRSEEALASSGDGGEGNCSGLCDRVADFNNVGGTKGSSFVGNFCHDLGFLPSDMDLEEFAADVETLLGKGLDDEPFGIDGLGLMECSLDVDQVEVSMECSLSTGRVKEEEEAEDREIEMAEPFELSFDYDEEAAGVEGGDEKVDFVEQDGDVKVVMKKKILLRLDYEGVMSAWAGSPWTSGMRPVVDPNECWPTCMGSCGIESHQCQYGDHTIGLGSRLGLLGDGGREARVSRYREKRRTRLFSKKIRYEVRKLNAEKRPRMKGRFVKRSASSFPVTAFPCLLGK